MAYLRQFALTTVLSIALAACAPSSSPASDDATEAAPGAGESGLPNPASVYCEEQGGQLEIRSDATGNQYGVCIFDDGTECDEWAYFRGECAPGDLETVPSPTAP